MFALRISGYGPATVWLLGLLALLLGGQCAFHLNKSGSTRTPPAAKLHFKMAMRLVRLDSISASAPDTCYVTIALQNLTDKPGRLTNLACTLWLDKQRLGYSFVRTAYRTLLPAHSEQVFTVALTPYATTDPHKGTDFRGLRAAWRQSRLARHRAHLAVFYGYCPSEGTFQESNHRINLVPLAR